jgi:Transposase domain (DUF772)
MYSARSERAFCERLNYDRLFKWFLELRIDAAEFDATTFTKNSVNGSRSLNTFGTAGSSQRRNADGLLEASSAAKSSVGSRSFRGDPGAVVELVFDRERVCR